MDLPTSDYRRRCLPPRGVCLLEVGGGCLFTMGGGVCLMQTPWR